MLRFWRKKRKIIIGIHGVGNKPPKGILETWWRKSIEEGLKRIGHKETAFNFELVYWAHFLYSEPQRPEIKTRGNPLYINDPYVPSLFSGSKMAPSRFRMKALDWAEKILDKIFLTNQHVFNVDLISDFIIRTKFRDLDLYYHNSNVAAADTSGLLARKLIRLALAQVLRKYRHDNILLIAHSMGSIVAYDVMVHEAPTIDVHTFMSLGSPLGLPAITKKIFIESKKDFWAEKRVPTPENIRHAWYNFSDLKDGIAMNYNLSDDYASNSEGVGPLDIIVNNDYEFQGRKNHHKSYGYLRTTEVAGSIHRFLTAEERKPFGLRLRDFFKKQRAGE